jgi:excisionase family DNA binding protein
VRDNHLFYEAQMPKSRPEILPAEFPEAVRESTNWPKLLFSQREGAHSLSVSLRTVQNLIATKQLPVRRIGRRVLIHRKDLEAFARRDPVSLGGE